MRTYSWLYVSITLLLAANSYLLFLVWELSQLPAIPLSGISILASHTAQEQPHENYGEEPSCKPPPRTSQKEFDPLKLSTDNAGCDQDRTSSASREQLLVHTVTAGESLWKIARYYGTTVETLHQINQLQTDQLRPGQTLFLPQPQ